MADLVMRKRPALHAGEMGLFIDSQVFEEDFEHIKTGTDIEVKATQSRNLKQMRLGWAIAARIAQSGVLGEADRREVMDWILMRCRHVRYVTNRHRDGVETIPVVKSIRFAAMDGTEFNRLFNRMIYIVISEILPEMAESQLREEVEKLSGVGTPEPEQPKRLSKPRKRRALPAPTSVIPPHDPETGEVIESPPVSDFPGDHPMPKAEDSPPAPTSSASPAPPPNVAATSCGKAAQAPSLPKNSVQWEIYAQAWVTSYLVDHEKTDQDMMVRWNNERSLRNECGVTSEQRQPVFEIYSAALDEKRRRR